MRVTTARSRSMTSTPCVDVNSCDNCCRQLTCDDEIPTCDDGQLRYDEVGLSGGLCLQRRRCLGGNCGPGYLVSGEVNCTGAFGTSALCDNCCEQLFCGTDRVCNLTLGEVVDADDGSPCTSDDCASCCRQLTCADDGLTCTPGQIHNINDDCEDGDCSNCCEDHLCIECDNEDQQSSGDPFCTDELCSNW
ncbi:hypothetical protein SARC_12525 [Sphaeroforma arctica JP610]|uniref:Uncharacterized protein n=1 Tax=Sphaeroforma arctica JP610 TaxID=667725 RepID=A0A0L0FFV7_9EUKA|nr:hypothetical protein SARC_12525 [Sphaeroforma arctica JP610]KNC74938.1 hypothetical protein SARC_12525 [Sphaeroforma arctica JP610]|eukprot:XP_014148840.1 hypothetical protein SARC_12525 [Sphaeroforma arctica JP610]